jgi:alanyl-tRNA synthetase
MQGFLREMEAHQQRSKEGADFGQAIFAGGPVAQLQETQPTTEFTGYKTLESKAKIIGIIANEELVESAEAGQEAAIVLDRTPAYAESGGQVGDHGCMVGEGDSRSEFREAVRERGFFLHIGRVTGGRMSVGDTVTCSVDRETRMATARNHTATHLLHYALRQVLGQHAKQAGSHVSPERLRFDFANPTELSAEQLRRIEDIVNEKILADEPLTTTYMGLSEAREAGAMALFGENYGDIVRVVSAGDFSRELCGGTHCRRTGQIGLFRITRESSIAGGVRRIEAVTGTGVLERLRYYEDEVAGLCDILGTQDATLIEHAKETLQRIRALQKQLQQARQQAARSQASGSLVDGAEQIAGARVVLAKMSGGLGELRSAADVLRQQNTGTVCLLAAPGDAKVALVAGVSQDMIERGLSARELAQEAAAILGGGGGGRDDLAQAGGPNVGKLDEAFERVRQIIRQQLGNGGAEAAPA